MRMYENAEMMNKVKTVKTYILSKYVHAFHFHICMVNDFKNCKLFPHI